MNSSFSSSMRRSLTRWLSPKRPAQRKQRLLLTNLEDRVTPSAPPAPTGFTATTTSFTDSTQQLISAAGTPLVTATINVSGVGPYLHDLDLTTLIKHINNADLDVSLTSPAGTTVTITTDNGSTFDDVYNGTLWDDDADPGNPAPFSGNTFAASILVGDTIYANLTVEPTLVPEEPLGAFIGENPNGTWTLKISDDLNANGGSLDQWKLDITTLDLGVSLLPKQTVSESPGTTISDNSNFTRILTVTGAPTYLQKLTLFTTITHTFGGDLDMTLTSPAGTVVTISSDNGAGNDNVFNGTLWDDDADPGSSVPYTFSANTSPDGTYTNLAAKPTLTPEEAFAAFIGENPNGNWILTVSDDATGDVGTLVNWSVNIQGAAPYGTPTASAVSVPNVTLAENGSSAYTFTVKFQDNVAIDYESILNNHGAIRVTGPNGFDQLATYVGIDTASDGTPRTATYSIIPPGTTWNQADSGIYTVSTVADEIFDTAGNAVVADQLATFQVSIMVVSSVASSGAGTLAENITLANLLSGPDTIVFDPSVFGTSAETISLTSPLPVITESLSILGPGSGLLTVQRNAGAATNFRIFDSTAANLTIRGLTAKGGNPDTGITGDGGGLQALGTAPTIVLEDTVFTQNSSTGEGAGIYMTSNGSLTVRNSRITGNVATSDGGGVYFFSGGSLLMENTTVANNTSYGAIGGGGVYFFGTASSFVVRNSIFNTNTTNQSGGGIHLRSFAGIANIQNSTFSGNVAAISGGAIGLTSGAGGILLENSTIRDNTANSVTAGQGGGGIGRTSTTTATATSFTTIVNSVLHQNSNGNGPDVFSSAQTTTNINYSSVFAALGHTPSGTSANNRPNNENPLLGPLSDNGGPTLTFAPQPGSPLINNGSNALVPGVLTTDQRGPGLIRSYGSEVDIGAFEVQPPSVTINQAVGQADPTNVASIDYKVVFQVPVTDFTGSDVLIDAGTLGGTTSASVSGSGTTYTVTVTGMTGEGDLVVSIPVDAAVDGSLTGNLASTSSDNSVHFDGIAPTVTINQGGSQADPTNGSPIIFDVHFDEPVVGLTDSDIDLSASSVGGTLVASVTDLGNGEDFTVSVTGMTGVGGVVATIPAAGVTDLAGNDNVASTSSDNFVSFDNVAPDVAIDQSIFTIDPTNVGPILFEVHFTEVMTGFAASDIDFSASTVGGTFSVNLITSNDQDWVVEVTGMSGEGDVIASIPAGSAFDAAGNGNNTSESVDNSVYFDNQKPSVTINQGVSQVDPTNGTPIVFEVQFDEPVSDFTNVDISFTGSTVGGLLSAAVTNSGDNMAYTVSVIGMSGEGQVVVSIPAGAALDALSNSSFASTSTDASVLFDAIAPTVSIEQGALQADPTNTGPIVFDVSFDEAVTGFTGSDISFTGSTVGGTLSASVTDLGNGKDYTVSVSGMTGNGDVVASIPAATVIDQAGNSNVASTSTDNSVEFDTASPTVTINQGAGQVDPTNGSTIVFDVVFNESVTGFTAADVSLSGTVGGILLANVSGSGTNYTVSVTGMTGVGTVIASIPAAAAVDSAGNSSVASTTSDNEVTFDEISPTVTIEQAVGQADPVTAGPILFDVHFDKAVTGFTDSDVSFAGSTVGGTLIASVSGSGADYVVSVTGMFGAGTVVASIVAGAAQDAATNSNLASTSVDNSVSYNGIGTISLDATSYTAVEGGLAVTVSVTRTNGTDGAVSFDYAFTNGTASSTDYSVAPAASGNLGWATGESDPIDFTVTIPEDLISEGAETVNIALSNLQSILGTVPLGTTSAILTIAKSDPVKVDASAKYKASFADEDGDTVTVKLSGKTGSLDVYLTDDTGPISSIDLVDTSSLKSTVTVSVKMNKLTGGNGLVTLNEVSGDGIKSFSGKAVNLFGPGGFNLGTNYVASIRLLDIGGGADIIAGGTEAQKTKIRAGVIADGTDILLTSILSNLTATSYADTDAGIDIQAPSVGNIAIKGNFGADIDISGLGVDHARGKKSLNKLDVKGIVDGSNINVVGNIGVVSVYNFLNSRLFGGYTGADDGIGTFNAIPTTITTFKTAKNAKLGLTGDFANSSVIASVIKTATLANVITTNGNDKFGIFAGDAFTTATVTIGGLKTITKNSGSFNQSGDFAIEIV